MSATKGTRWGAVASGWVVAFLLGFLVSPLLRLAYGVLAGTLADPGELTATVAVVAVVSGFSRTSPVAMPPLRWPASSAASSGSLLFHPSNKSTGVERPRCRDEMKPDGRPAGPSAIPYRAATGAPTRGEVVTRRFKGGCPIWDGNLGGFGEKRKDLMRGLDAWSVHDLDAEITQTFADMCAARALERAAEARHLSERTPEAEIAYEGLPRGFAERRSGRSVSARGTHDSQRSLTGEAERRPGGRKEPASKRRISNHAKHTSW